MQTPPDPSELPDRSAWILAVLAEAPSIRWELPRLRIALFLLGRRLGLADWFRFVAHSYGPYDASVGRGAEALVARGLVKRDGEPGEEARYSLTGVGAKTAAEAPSKDKATISEITTRIGSLGYRELLADVYRQYPDIRLEGLSGYVPGHTI
ncbi:MAG: hypothetical protein RL885_13400 [Planctomycetota bacterium]